MGDGGGGFFKGTSSEQDSRFGDKTTKLMKSMSFPAVFKVKVDMSKVNVEVLKPWVAKKITEIVGVEDDLVVGFVFQLLEDRKLDPRQMQIQLTGFLESRTAGFMQDLWKLLISAQESIGGIPRQFMEAKMEELKREREEKERTDAQLKLLQEKRNAESSAVKQDGHATAPRGDQARVVPRHPPHMANREYQTNGGDRSRPDGEATRGREVRRRRSQSRSRSPSRTKSPRATHYRGERKRKEVDSRDSRRWRSRSRTRSRSKSPPRYSRNRHRDGNRNTGEEYHRRRERDSGRRDGRDKERGNR